MPFDAHANFAYSTVATAPSPAASGPSLVVGAGQGTRFPTAPFNAIVWPVSVLPTFAVSEIVRVTAVSTDTLTITRGQENTAGRTIVVGDQIALAPIQMKVIADIERAAKIRSVAISFTDGGLLKRVTITDADVTASNLVWGSITRNVTETTDTGFLYIANVASQTAGSFEIIVFVYTGLPGTVPDPLPNETVTYCYRVF